MTEWREIATAPKDRVSTDMLRAIAYHLGAMGFDNLNVEITKAAKELDELRAVVFPVTAAGERDA